MKAIRYKTIGHYDIVEASHSGYGGHEVTEIFVPEAEICFNIFNGILNIFESDNPRELSGEKIEIGDAFAERLKVFVNLKEEIEEEARQYFD